MAAVLNYPLWRASAVGQSGFRVVMSNSAFSSMHPSLQPFIYAFCPPYKGLLATVAGMSWARAAIFYGSDVGREMLLSRGYDNTTSTLVPPLIVSSSVQVVNMPLVRATVMLQDPQSSVQNIRDSLKRIYSNHGLPGLWHGTSAGILKTVPKYCSAIFVKELLEEALPPVDPASPTKDKDALIRAAIKSSFAGVAGAVLTNPLDVIRNEMFKTNLSLVESVKVLHRELGWSFLVRGMSKNLIAVSIPVATTIFFTDALIQYSKST